MKIKLLLSSCFSFFGKSHRWGHLLGGLAVGLLLGLPAALAVAAALEFKDVQHSHGNDRKPLRSWNWSAWDWLDVLAGLLGTIPALAIHAALYLLLSNL